LTGANHSGAELHGFLSYLVKCTVTGRPFNVYGYKGKQVRDQIHAFDVIRAFEAFICEPSAAAVYNLGGGRENSISMVEAIAAIESRVGRRLAHEYVDVNRSGDHICYISDLRRLTEDYPNWSITWPLDQILDELVESELVLKKETSRNTA
jgi:CDP-paratose 2-epimerase